MVFDPRVYPEPLHELELGLEVGVVRQEHQSLVILLVAQSAVGQAAAHDAPYLGLCVARVGAPDVRLKGAASACGIFSKVEVLPVFGRLCDHRPTIHMAPHHQFGEATPGQSRDRGSEALGLGPEGIHVLPQLAEHQQGAVLEVMARMLSARRFPRRGGRRVFDLRGCEPQKDRPGRAVGAARVVGRARNTWLGDAIFEAEVLQVGHLGRPQRVGVLVQLRQVSHRP